MLSTVCVASLLAGASALVAPAPAKASKALAGSLDGMLGADVETGGAWDPLSFSEIHGLIQGSYEDLGSEHAGVMPHPQWLRESEIKHGRIAMLAFTGALVQSYGMHFPGTLSGFYYEEGVAPLDAVPSAFATNPIGMAQILLWIGVTEGIQFPEGAWGGTMKRAPGDMGYFFGMDGKDLEAQKLKELKNGRAAMVGIMAFSAAHFIPGSVPFFFNA